MEALRPNPPPLAHSYAVFIMFESIRGIFAGHVMSQRATITADIVGRARVNIAVGVILFCTSLGLLTGRGIGGEKFDVLHEVKSCFWSRAQSHNMIFFCFKAKQLPAKMFLFQNPTVLSAWGKLECSPGLRPGFGAKGSLETQMLLLSQENGIGAHKSRLQDAQ